MFQVFVILMLCNKLLGASQTYRIFTDIKLHTDRLCFATLMTSKDVLESILLMGI